MSRPGADLALLLLAAFRAMADEGSAELARLGYDDVRPAHDFALHSILSGADSASELGKAMSVSKQAAAKTIAILEERGYLVREPDPADRRRVRLRVTDHGQEMLREGQAVFDSLRQRWEGQVGADTVAALESTLRNLVGSRVIRIDSPGWDARDPDA